MREPKKPSFKNLKQDARKLKRILRDRKWHKSRNIPLPHRTIRAICERYPDKVLSGQQGYKATRFASEDEIRYAVNDLRSRIAHISRRANKLAELLPDGGY